MHPSQTDYARHIAEGNAQLAADHARNLAVHKEILEPKPYPVCSYHWTEKEFTEFLDAHRFPPNTYRDRLVWRREAVVKALASGKYVPAEVLEEDENLIQDAVDSVLSELAWDRFNQRLKEQQSAFERHIGYYHSEEVYTNSLQAMLKVALKREPEHIRNGFVFGEWALGLTIDEGRKGQPGIFGSFNDRPKTLQIRASDPSSWNILHAFEWERVDRALFDLLTQGEVTFDQVWCLTGTGWVPSCWPVYVQSLKSQELHAA